MMVRRRGYVAAIGASPLRGRGRGRGWLRGVLEHAALAGRAGWLRGVLGRGVRQAGGRAGSGRRGNGPG